MSVLCVCFFWVCCACSYRSSVEAVLTVPFLLLLLLLGQLSLFFLFSSLFLSRLLLKPLSSLLVSLLLRLVKGGLNIEVQPGKVHWFFSRRRWSGCCHCSCRLVALQQAVRKTEDEVGKEEPSAHNKGLRGCYGRGKLRGGRSCCAVSGLEIFVRLFLLWHLWRAVHVVRLRVAQVVEAPRTSSNLQETHHHRASTVCRVLLHYFGVVQAPRTYTNHTILTITELARCEGCLSTRSGWFKHIEPHRSYTSHTITEIARCVGCLGTSSGWFKHSEPQRTYTKHPSTEIARCVGCLCTRSGWFKHSEPTRTTPSRRAMCVGYFCTSSGWFTHLEPQRTYTNHTITERARCVGCFCTRSGWFKHSEPPRSYTLHTITEIARCVGCFCTSSGSFKHSEPTRTTPSQCSRCVGH